MVVDPEDLYVKGRHQYQHKGQTMNGVNGINGHGDLNGGSGGDIISTNNLRGCWTIGLINSKFRYLTAETFGFKINANGASLKKKQVWTLEPASGGAESTIFLRSHLDKYLAVDSFGNVTCEGEEKEPGSKFQISVADDGTGRWAFRNVVRGYYLGASSDKLTCTAKVPGDAEFWHVHLAARPQTRARSLTRPVPCPQVNLRSVGRKRFAHLSENLDEIHVDANIPWGEDTLFTLEFRPDESGKYALHTCNNKYLSREGKLVDTCNPNCLFSAEYHGGQLALRDRQGAYLSPIGSKAVLKSRSTSVTKDELFSLEDSLPQASFVAALNARYVSVKQGILYRLRPAVSVSCDVVESSKPAVSVSCDVVVVQGIMCRLRLANSLSCDVVESSKPAVSVSCDVVVVQGIMCQLRLANFVSCDVVESSKVLCVGCGQLFPWRATSYDLPRELYSSISDYLKKM
uniref:Fascin-like domain-containing protein n=1 Tax=Timema genevievae TaxID=629358 RepID=A0A7R9K2J2_TIMGE|nr:unnamed protein product [Timema genevievae]